MNEIFGAVVNLVLSPVKLVADIAGATVSGVGEVISAAGGVIESVADAVDEIGSN